MNQRKSIAAATRAERFYDIENRSGCNCSIDCVASVPKYIDTSLSGKRLRRSHHCFASQDIGPARHPTF
jgi:hypothetical protein